MTRWPKTFTQFLGAGGANLEVAIHSACRLTNSLRSTSLRPRLRPSPGLIIGRAGRQLRFQIGRDSLQYAAIEPTIRSGRCVAFQQAVLSDDERSGDTRPLTLQTQQEKGHLLVQDRIGPGVN